MNLRQINEPSGEIVNPTGCENAGGLPDRNPHQRDTGSNQLAAGPAGGPSDIDARQRAWADICALARSCDDLMGVVINVALCASENPHERTSQCLKHHLAVHQKPPTPTEES